MATVHKVCKPYRVSISAMENIARLIAELAQLSIDA